MLISHDTNTMKYVPFSLHKILETISISNTLHVQTSRKKEQEGI